MISIIHKLYPTEKQKAYLNDCLFSAVGIENWCITQIKKEHEYGFPLARMKPLQIRSILSKKIEGHSKKSGLPSKLLNDCIAAVCESFKRHKNIHKLGFKSIRKKKSFYFNGDIKISKEGRLKLPNIKTTFKMSEMNKFQGQLKKVTLIRKFNGWCACCVYDESRKPIEITDSKEAGIDPGLKTSMTFSDGTEIQFPKFYQKSQQLQAKLQRKSKNSKKVKRLQAQTANKRKDHHHKLSTTIAKEYQKIYWSNDSFKGLIQMFGKSYANLALGKFRDLLTNKLASRIDGFGELIKVSNRKSTLTCSACLSLTGPTGWSGLGVRNWVCSSCGAAHDRDVNAAINTLISGQGLSAVKGNQVNRNFTGTDADLSVSRVPVAC